MLDSLNSKYDLASMRYDQIIELLGKNGVAEDSGNDKITYYIGRGKLIQPFLKIEFNDGIVSSIVVNTRTD
jgi:hypothetical protein